MTIIDDTHLPLHNEDCERNVLGELLHCTNGQILEACEQLTESCFYNTRHKTIFTLMRKTAHKGEEWSLLSASVACSKANIGISTPELAELYSHGFGSAIGLYQSSGIPLLKELAEKRKLYDVAQSLFAASLSYSADVPKVVNETTNILNAIINGQTTDISTMTNTLEDVTNIVNSNLKGDSIKHRTTTGFPFIDKKGGLQPTDLVVIAGATSMGKTSFADSVVLHSIEKGKRIAFYSLEMTRQQLVARLLSSKCNIYSNKILNGVLDSHELSIFDKSVGDLWNCSKNLFFDDNSTSTIDKILTSIRRLHSKFHIHGAVIDYIQLIGGQERGQSKEQFIAQVARRLKNLAKELGIWIIVLSQLNRDKDNPLPSLDRMRDSGQIAEASDMVIMIYRPEYYNLVEGRNLHYPQPFTNVDTTGTALIMIEKGRNIGTGSFICGFNASTTHFYPLDVLPERGMQQTKNDCDIPSFPY